MNPSAKSPVLLYLIMALGLIVGYLYNSQTNPASLVEPVPAKYGLSKLKGLDTAKIDFSILDSPQFKNLRIFGQLPVDPGTSGNTDPFR